MNSADVVASDLPSPWRVVLGSRRRILLSLLLAVLCAALWLAMGIGLADVIESPDASIGILGPIALVATMLTAWLWLTSWLAIQRSRLEALAAHHPNAAVWLASITPTTLGALRKLAGNPRFGGEPSAVRSTTYAAFTAESLEFWVARRRSLVKVVEIPRALISDVTPPGESAVFLSISQADANGSNVQTICAAVTRGRLRGALAQRYEAHQFVDSWLASRDRPSESEPREHP